MVCAKTVVEREKMLGLVRTRRESRKGAISESPVLASEHAHQKGLFLDHLDERDSIEPEPARRPSQIRDPGSPCYPKG